MITTQDQQNHLISFDLPLCVVFKVPVALEATLYHFPELFCENCFVEEVVNPQSTP